MKAITSILRHWIAIVLTVALLPAAARAAATRDARLQHADDAPAFESAVLIQSSLTPQATQQRQIDWRTWLVEVSSRVSHEHFQTALDSRSSVQPSNLHASVTTIAHVDGYAVQLITRRPADDRIQPWIDVAKAGPSREVGTHSACLPAAP